MSVIPSASSTPATDQPHYRELDKHGVLVACERCGNAVADTDQHDAWHRYIERVKLG